MTIKDDVKSLIAKEAWTMTDVAGILYKTENKRIAASSLSQKLKNETIKYREILQIADILGYDVEFKKRNK